MTEYLSDKVIRENGIEPKFTDYPELVSIVEDLNELYGEKVMIDSYLDSPATLEALMAKDGKYYTELLEMTDDYYREVYNHKTLSSWKAKRQESARLKYQKIGQYIEDIKEKRRKENPGIVLKESKWKESLKKESEKVELYQYMDRMEGFRNIEKDLSDLYGKEAVDKAIFGNDDKLKDLIEKEGKDYTEFKYLLDDCHLFMRSDSSLSPYIAAQQEMARKKYLEIGRFIEDIKEKRQKENPENALGKSHWKDAYINQFGGKEEDLQKLGLEEKSVKENVAPKKETTRDRVITWFKNLKDKITGRFKKEDETLMLGAGSVPEYPLTNEEEPSYSLQEEREDFLEEIRVEESELITPQKAKEESQQKDKTKDDEQMEL